jgi:hypothetical protein
MICFFCFAGLVHDGCLCPQNDLRYHSKGAANFCIVVAMVMVEYRNAENSSKM